MQAKIETQIQMNSSDGLRGIKDITELNCKDAKAIIGALQTLPIFYDRKHLERVYNEIVASYKRYNEYKVVCEHTLTVNGIKSKVRICVKE